MQLNLFTDLLSLRKTCVFSPVLVALVDRVRMCYMSVHKLKSTGRN